VPYPHPTTGCRAPAVMTESGKAGTAARDDPPDGRATQQVSAGGNGREALALLPSHSN
jgi:hypothetical protein